ncbi:hypothetical protein G3O00_40705 [Burkholderia sp. Ac-20384]|uniref:hypothetical protein n=1 Tax=Burkholderia sp. Ac-20384 TaxID=2703902 RepID=UPI00197EB8E0|nr:hypothetical protein [Burkholderia sp. Ac-20384]MBN3829850.1 hypothetical protein [Burkholderia sp. Ac-20384]
MDTPKNFGDLVKQMENCITSVEGPWRLYDFDTDGLVVFDGGSCDYYLLCYTDGSLDNGVVIKATAAGPRGLFADRDASGAFGMSPIDPRSVAAFVEVKRPEFSDELLVALARSRKKVAFWHDGILVGAIEARRPREQLAELYDRAFAIADGDITVFEGGRDEVPEDAYWVDQTIVVTPVRIDVSVLLTTERIVQEEDNALLQRTHSENRALKRHEKRMRRDKEDRLLALGLTFDETPAMNAIAVYVETLGPFGLLDEFEAYVLRIIEKHFPSYVVGAAADPDAVLAACAEAQTIFEEKCRHKINLLLAEVPKLQQREKIRSDFESRTGLKLLFSAEVTQLVGGSKFFAGQVRENARSYLSPVGNQRLYARDDIERELAVREQKRSSA